MAWWFSLLVSVAFSVIAYLLTPRPKQPKPPEVKDLEAPTADAGRPIPVVFGTMTVQGLNVLWYGDVNKRTFQVDA
jgi:hypothetical protein